MNPLLCTPPAARSSLPARAVRLRGADKYLPVGRNLNSDIGGVRRVAGHIGILQASDSRRFLLILRVGASGVARWKAGEERRNEGSYR